MNLIAAYARMYLWCLTEALKAIVKNAWTLVLPLLLAVIARLAFPLAMRLPDPLGGFAMGLLLTALFSSYLYFLGQIVVKSKVTLAELRQSVVPFFWSLGNLYFVLWIANMALTFVLAGNPQRGVISAGLNLILAIVLNPAPETIYQKGTRGGIDTITTSFRFLQENWIEWFLPPLAIGGIVYAITGQQHLLELVLNLVQVMVSSSWLGLIVFTVVIHVGMVYRGFLYSVLDGTGHRQRLYRFRKGGTP